MTLDIAHKSGHPTTFMPLNTALKQPTNGAVPPEEMSLATLAALVEAVTSATTDEQRTRGKSGGASTVQLREPAMDDQAAKLVLAGVIITLPNLLAALATASDPIQYEAGAETRVTEGVAVQSQPRADVNGPAAVMSQVTATGADTDVADRSAHAGAFIKSSPFSNLLALLRQLLLRFEKLDRDNSAQMVEIQRQITIIAGEKGVEKAKESLVGAIGAAVMTGAIGAAALKQTFKSTSMQVRSADKNAMDGNKLDAVVKSSSGVAKGNTTPTADMRPSRGVDGTPVKAGPGGDRPSAAVQADADAPPGMKHIGREQPAAGGVDELHADHPEVGARSQIPAGNAMLLNMMGPGIGNAVGSGVQIEAEMTEAERQLLLQVADVFRRIADEQQDQSARSREMRDAAAQLYESLLNLISSTSAHIISKS